MSQVAINKSHDSGAVYHELQNAGRIVREEAFNLFRTRSDANSSDIDEWQQAKRDVAWSPPSELVDEGKAFSASLAVPGFDANYIKFSALPDALVIEADSSDSHDKQLFRRINLPGRLDVDHVSASLDEGILRTNAKANRSR